MKAWDDCMANASQVRFHLSTRRCIMVLIKKAQAVPGLDGWLLVEFSDGNRKFVDITPHMDCVLEKLKDPEFFKQVFVDEELRTVSWPGELDIDPDNLYEEGIPIKAVENLTNAVKTKVTFVDFIDQQRA